MSSYEEKVISLLKKSKLKFEREKRFNDLRMGRLRFDFYVYVHGGPAIVEVNGEQHYQFVSRFYKSRQDFMAARERDRRKISYCLAHKIPIYVIPYWEIENLTCAADLFQERFRAKTRWKNDTDYYNFQNLTKR